MGKDDLTQIELQICVDFVNTVVQDEHDCELSYLFVIFLLCTASRGRLDLLYSLCYLFFLI